MGSLDKNRMRMLLRYFSKLRTFVNSLYYKPNAGLIYSSGEKLVSLRVLRHIARTKDGCDVYCFRMTLASYCL